MNGSRRVKILTLLVSFLCCFFMGAAACAQQQIDIKNSSRYLKSGRYSWTLCLSADSSVLDSIAYVDYTLPPSFKNSTPRVTREESRNFSLNETGQGEFGILLRVTYRDGSSTDLKYWLALSQEKNDCSGSSNNSVSPMKSRSSRKSRMRRKV